MSTSTYRALPEKIKDAFFAGDWFRPSDIGLIDDDGCLYYVDRAKDRINTPTGVIGLGQDDSETMVGAVKLKPGHVGDAGLAQEIIKAMQAVLSPHDCPSGIVFVQELPTVPGGAKVRREELRTQVEAMAKVA